MTTRAARRASRQPSTTLERFGPLLFGLLVIVILALGGFLAFKDFLLRPAAAPGSVSVQSSMAGFTPSDIRVAAGSVATLDWWTQDAAIHLQGGVHTMIAPELGLYETLAAEGRRTVTWQVPDMPGTYDVYCDTCCGGKDSPSMHGRIVIEPTA